MGDLKQVIPKEIHGRWFYEVPDQGRTFTRLVGAIAFPWGSSSGISAFLGCGEWDRITRNEPVYWVDEVEHSDLSVLLEETEQRVKYYSCGDFWGNTRNPHFRDELQTWNRRRDDLRLKRLEVRPVPRATAEGYLLPFYGLLRERGRKDGPQSLFLNEASVLPNALSEILPDVAPGLRDTDNPAAAALCYAVGGVEATVLNPYEEQDGGFLRDAYDCLNYTNNEKYNR